MRQLEIRQARGEKARLELTRDRASRSIRKRGHRSDRLDRAYASGHRAAPVRRRASITSTQRDQRQAQPAKSSDDVLQRHALGIASTMRSSSQRRLRHRARLSLHRFSDPRLDWTQRDGRRALGHRLSRREFSGLRSSLERFNGDHRCHEAHVFCFCGCLGLPTPRRS